MGYNPLRLQLATLRRFVICVVVWGVATVLVHYKDDDYHINLRVGLPYGLGVRDFTNAKRLRVLASAACVEKNFD